jgi:hypothetical protein
MQHFYQMWYIPQIPMKAFTVETATPKEAERILWVLESFSDFEYLNNIKPDYADVGGICVWDEQDQEWVDYHPEDEE